MTNPAKWSPVNYTPQDATDLRMAALAGDPASALNARLLSTYVPHPTRPTVDLAPVPVWLNSRRRWQQSAYCQDNVTTLADGTQYAVVVDDDLHPVIIKRTAPSRTWEQYDLRDIADDPFGEQVDDSHNTYSVAVDDDGHIHVVGNMHSEAMKYARTTVAGDITSLADATVHASNTDLVSYPMFFRDDDGGLHLAWRNGYATSGDWYLTSYDTATDTWAAPTKWFDGAVSSEGPYLWRIAVRDGKIAVFFCWRGSGDASTNTDLCYVESIDNGATWRTIDGTAQTVPITHANADVILPVENAEGLINQGGADLDADGRPHAAIQLYDADGYTQLHHVYWDGAAWQSPAVTEWGLTVVTVGATTLYLSVGRPHLVCGPHGRTYMIARTEGEGYRNRPLLIDATPGADHTPGVLADIDVAHWEPSIDSRALRERGELTMLLATVDPVSNAKEGWLHQFGGILTLDLAHAPAVIAGQTRIPTIRTIDRFGWDPEVTPVGGTSEANIVTFGVPQIDIQRSWWRGGLFFARLSCRISLNSGTTSGTIKLRETPSSGSLPTNDLCVIAVASSAYSGIQSTPWEPLRGTPYVEAPADGGWIRDTRLIPRFVCNNAAGFKIGAWSVEIGVLDYV